jgi:DNA-binding GntR family transcriptional regulator
LRRRIPPPPIALDRTVRAPLHEQLREALYRAIACGDLPPGTALPSSRVLAAHLGVSRNTVLAAYEDLAADGLLAGRAGSATRVLRRGGNPARRLDVSGMLRAAHYPERQEAFSDPDGHRLYLHR